MNVNISMIGCATEQSDETLAIAAATGSAATSSFVARSLFTGACPLTVSYTL